MTIPHTYFGKITTKNVESDVYWEKECNLNGDDFTIQLWADTIEDLSTETLEKFAHYCQNISKNDKNCREDMIKELHTDDSYMTENLGGIQEQVNSPKMQKLIDESATIEQFVEAMNLTSVLLSAKDYDYMEKPSISFDYMIDEEYSNAILCVCYDLDGNLIYVAHES